MIIDNNLSFYIENGHPTSNEMPIDKHPKTID